jgi:hypothetical protein
MDIELVPDALRERLGLEATTGLLQLLERAHREGRADLMDASADRYERRLAEEIGGVRVQIAQVEGALRRDMAEMGASIRQEMAEMGASIRQEMAEMGASIRQEMAEMGASIRQDMARMGATIRQEMPEMTASIRQDMARMDADIRRGYGLRPRGAPQVVFPLLGRAGGRHDEHHERDVPDVPSLTFRTSALDRDPFLAEHTANPIAQVSLKLDGTVNDSAARAAGALEVLAELL